MYSDKHTTMRYLYLFFLLFFNVAFSQSHLPNTTLKTLQGTETNLLKLSKDHDLMVVSLWATWCVPCKNELDTINDVYQNWKEETGVVFYAVSIDDSRTLKNVRPMVNGKDWELEILLDTNNNLKRKLSVTSIPLTLIIKKGKIIYRHSGYTPGAEEDIYAILKKNS